MWTVHKNRKDQGK
jgi:hypothetical protein